MASELYAEAAAAAARLLAGAGAGVKTLTATLEAAQKAASSLPYVQALLADYDGYARRGRFTRHYDGSETAGPAAACMAPDGSLVRLRRKSDAVALEYSVAASADDAQELAGTVTLTDTEAQLDATNEWAGFRFLGVAVPAGATVLRARLFVVQGTGDDPTVTVYGQDADDAGAFTTGASDISGRSKTSASVSWHVTGGAGEVESPDLSAIVQEIVDRGGWASGQDLALLVQGGSSALLDFRPAMYDHTTEAAPRLELVYVTGAREVYVSRVASPAPGSTFSSWSLLDGGVSYQTGVALAASSSALYAFLVDDDLVTLKVYTSSSNGASWSGPSTVSAAGGEKTHLAAAAADDGDVVVFWAEVDGVVYRSRWNGASWGARTAWTPSVASVSGLAATYGGDWQVIVAGAEASTLDARVWAVRYGDGAHLAADTWGTLREVAGAFAGSLVTFSAPAVGYTSECWRLFFVESYGGDAAYDRLQWSTMTLLSDFNDELWREPVAFDLADGQGVAIAAATSRIWLASYDGVWSSPLPANAELDVSAQVLGCEVEVITSGGRVELELEASLWGEALLTRGTRLQLTPGYRTSSDEAPGACSYWVESVELVTGPRPRVVVKARDGWALLERWRARRQFVWAAGDRAVSQLLLFLAARAGVEYTTVGTSDALTAVEPAFTVHAGESGLTAVRRLLAMVEDAPLWDGARLVTVLTADDDEAGYSLGGDGEHAVVEAKYFEAAPEFNRVRVLGLGVSGEAFDFADAGASGERIAQVIDVNLVDAGDAADRAAAVLRRSVLATELAEVRLFGVHCGVELWDVVELTDAQASIEAQAYRVNAYGWRFEPARGRYDAQLTLGPV